MEVVNLTSDKEIVYTSPDMRFDDGNKYFLLCNTDEITLLQARFFLAQETIEDCVNIDENIRFTTYKDYDFISLIYFYLQDKQIQLQEVNIYNSKAFVILVLPVNPCPYLKELGELLIERAKAIASGDKDRLYYAIFDIIITDFFNTLDKIEDLINDTEKNFLVGNVHGGFDKISTLKECIYIIKKHIRPLIYIGDLLVANINKLIEEDEMHIFTAIDIRLNKLYDFSVSLTDYANQTLDTYDSKIAAHTNDVINKLTIVTMFFAPITMISGIYGMNFMNMPELAWQHGYFLVIGLMVIITISLFIYFKSKRWL